MEGGRKGSRIEKEGKGKILKQRKLDKTLSRREIEILD